MNIFVEHDGIARFQITPGVTAVIGSGGKTALLRLLARTLPGTVLLTTTTRIMPFSDYPFLDDPTESEVKQALHHSPVICVGLMMKDREANDVVSGPSCKKKSENASSPTRHGTIGAPRLGMATLAALADYVLVEADGSRQLPLKAHALWEPVVPECSTRTIQLVGASGFNERVADVVHRFEIFCELAGCTPNDLATPEHVARVLSAEHRAKTVTADILLINQVTSEATASSAQQLAAALSMLGDNSSVMATSLAPEKPGTPR